MFSAIVDFIAKQRSKSQMGRKGLIGSRKRRTQDDSLAAAADKSKPLNIAILAILWLLCSLILNLPLEKAHESTLVVGQSAPETIFAKFDFRYLNPELTKEKREKAMAAVPLFFQLNADSVQSCRRRTEYFFQAVKERLSGGKLSLNGQTEYDKITRLVRGMDSNTLHDFAYIFENEGMKRQFMENLELALNHGIIDSATKDSLPGKQMIRIIDSKGRCREPKPIEKVMTASQVARLVVQRTLVSYPASEEQAFAKVMTRVVELLLGSDGNLKFDKLTTEKRRQQAAKETTPYIENIKKDQCIIKKGQTVSKQLLEQIKLYNKEVEQRRSPRDILRHKIELMSWCLILMLVIGFYLYNVNPDIIKSNQKVLLTAATIVMSLGINYSAVRVFSFFSTQLSMLPVLVIAVIPLALPAIVLAVTVGLRSAIYIGFFVSILTAMMMNNSYNIVLQGLIVSCFAGMAVRNSSNYRSFFLRAVGIAFLLGTLLNFDMFLKIVGTPNSILHAFGVIISTAIATGILSLLLVFLFELLFNISTNMSLLMFCDYNHPLLRRLQLEAPGTFYHSLSVSTLAEYAADSIGANPIKARVGALFHDIGKLVKPEYFTENSLSEQKHTDLHPRMSSLIILNHVKDGVDLAMKYKLRKIIRDAIEQHHGTDIVYFFYQKALKENRDSGGSVSETEYRYPGPLPREKEVVIISLADACEAASRSLQKPTPTKIEALIWEIFRKRIRDGQLDEADLTFAELTQIRKSFVKTLVMMNHGRIAYPKSEENDESDLFMAARKTASPSNNKSRETDKKGS